MPEKNQEFFFNFQEKPNPHKGISRGSNAGSALEPSSNKRLGNNRAKRRTAEVHQAPLIHRSIGWLGPQSV